MKLIYFAGSVDKNDWRNKLVSDTQERIMSNGRRMVYKTRDGGEFAYGGPEAIGCDHGCCHGNGTHGMIGSPCVEQNNKPGDIISNCLAQIKIADVLFVYISKPDSYATYLEVGYAFAINKPCYLYINPELNESMMKNRPITDDWNHNEESTWHDLWFMKNLCKELQELKIPKELLTYTSPKQQYHDYLQSEQWKTIARKKREEADNRCQLCNNGSITLHVHHRTYDNIYHEKMNDLIVLCENCHKKFHNKGGNNG